MPAPNSMERYSISQLSEMARMVAESKLFPGITSEASAFTLMMLCQAEGLHPMQALRRFHIVGGRPAMRADAMLAEFQRAGGRVRWDVTDNKQCAATFFHHVQTPDEGVLVGFTIDDAKTAGLLSNPTWSKYPSAMLRARVISTAVRMILPGIIVGISSVEELEDMASVPTQAIASSTSARSLTSSPPPSAVVAPAAPDAVRLNTQDGESHDARPYHVVIQDEVQALNGEIVIRNHEAKQIERHQFHRHLLKAAGEAGVIERIAAGTKLSTSQVLERCQDLYRDHRDWTRAEIRTYGDKLFQAVQPAPTTEVEPEADKQVLAEFDREPGADG